MAFVAGRALEMGAVSGAVRRLAHAGTGGAILLEGVAGIGKTHLCAAASALAGEAGVRVVPGTTGADRHVPDGAVRALLDQLGARPAGSAAGAAHGAAERLAAACEQTPTLAVVDDLQSADPGSMAIVGRLVRLTRRVPLLLVLATRPRAGRDALEVVRDLAVRHGGSVIPLRPLDGGAVRAMAVHLGVPAGATGPIVEDAGGIPLYVSELASAAKAAPHLPQPAVSMLAPLVEERLDELTLAAREVVTVVAAMAICTAAQVAAVVGCSAADVVDPLVEASHAGFLSEVGGRIVFEHEVSRSVVERLTDPQRLRALHRTIADVLGRGGAPAAIVAEHAARAATGPDREAARWFRQAAREAAGTSPATAVELLDRARGHLGEDDAGTIQIEVERLDPLLWSGQVGRCAASARWLVEALEAAGRRTDAAAVRRRLGAALEHIGRGHEALEALRAARAAARSEDLPPLLGEIAKVRVMLLDVRGAQLDASHAIAVAEARGDDLGLVGGLAARAAAMLAQGRVADALSDCDQLGDVAAGAAAHEVGTTAGWFAPVASALLDADRHDDAEVVLTDARRALERYRSPLDLLLVEVLGAHRALIVGHWDDATGQASAALALADEHGAHLTAPWASAIAAFVAWQRGDTPSASAHLATALERLDAPGAVPLGLDLVVVVQAAMAEAGGDPAAAAAAVWRAWDLFHASEVRAFDRTLAPDAVRLALAVGQRQRAREGVARVEEAARRSTAPSLLAAAALAAAHLGADPDACDEAVQHARSSGRALLHAQCAHAAAVARLAAGDRLAARSLLVEALGRYEVLGARPAVADVLRTMRQAGMRRPRRSRAAGTQGWSSLTATEWSIVELVRSGLSNGQIAEALRLSRRTVASRLVRIYAKLGGISRVELAASEVRRGG